MKKNVALLIIAASFFCGLHQAGAETIKMGFFEIKPHIFIEKGVNGPQGASIKYFETIASHMGYEVEWIGPLPFPRLIKSLQDGFVDGSLMMNKNKDREKFMHYPDNSYYLVYSVFAVKKENKLNKITSINDVKGYRVGFLKGAHQTGFLKNNLDKFEMQYVSGKNWVEQNLGKLLKSRVDAIYDLNSATLPYEAKMMNIQDKIKILTLPEPPGAVNVVFSKQSSKGKILLDRYNKAVFDLNPVYDNYLDEFINSD